MSDGSVKAGTAFPTLAAVYAENKDSLVYEFIRITSEFNDGADTYKGTFWVTGDALKWEIPNKSPYELLYAMWNKEKQEPDPADDNGAMLCRLPGTPPHNQAIADLITTHPNGVASGATDGLVHFSAPLLPNMKPERSLLLTPLLYDLRWAQSKGQIRYCNQDTAKPIVAESAKMNRCVNEQIRALMKKSSSSSTIPTVGDPGKIWAITNAIYTEKEAKETKKDGTAYTHKYKAVVNYGWHSPTAQYDAVTPGQKVAQSVGTRHDANQIDYSQICVLVAGWCEVTRPGKSAEFMRTEAVYASKDLCRLVVHDKTPLTVTRY